MSQDGDLTAFYEWLESDGLRPSPIGRRLFAARCRSGSVDAAVCQDVMARLRIQAPRALLGPAPVPLPSQSGPD